ncbi:hypothetical protein [Maribacter polysaccharolyticus]|uniref:hypothetical protein n=1 Tax=Maribacter polysaccharolyticus TaxID=3020831 RepID=UPI00237F612C|nr:hypothetical protein [Maribacter polysaccharolyticus]MDE3742579.1 hypothetical protein [Maribacter polysaccharolyticus]
MKISFRNIFIILLSIGLFSCEQDRLEPELETAEGGGTLSSYMAYTISSVDAATDVYGRVVFWEEPTLSRTLIQVSLYNTTDSELLPVSILDGAIGDESSVLMSIYDVDGSTGELDESKFYTVTDTDFYESLSTLDAHINIYDSTGTILAAGDIGSNADPVESN